MLPPFPRQPGKRRDAMMRSCVVSLLVVSAVGLLVAADGPGPAARVEDEKAIRDVIERMGKAWNAHDIKAFSKDLDEDVAVVNRFGHWMNGRAEVERHLSGLHASPYRDHLMDRSSRVEPRPVPHVRRGSGARTRQGGDGPRPSGPTSSRSRDGRWVGPVGRHHRAEGTARRLMVPWVKSGPGLFNHLIHTARPLSPPLSARGRGSHSRPPLRGPTTRHFSQWCDKGRAPM